MNTIHSSKSAYAKNTAGYRMTTRVPTAGEGLMLGDLHRLLKDHATEYDTVNYVYVLSETGALVGVLSVRDIFTHDPSSKAGEVCVRLPLYSVHPGTHQEKAAFLALRHNIKAVPVVGADKKFLGEITADTVLSILHMEMREDAFRKVGIRHPAAMHGTVFTVSVFGAVRHRLPWLIIGLLGGLLAAKIIGFYEDTLSKNIILAAFIPLIVYISDAVGTQMEAYIIRDLAVEHSIPFVRYFLRQLVVVFVIGSILAGLLFATLGVVRGEWHIAAVLACSLFFAVLSSVLTGLLIPYLFSKMSLDPADASGPVATIFQDMLSILIYFWIATALL